MFRKALIRLSRDMLSVLGRRRDRRCEREREVAEGLRVLRQPSRPSGLSDEEIALRAIKFRICRELLSGEYKNTDLADKLAPEEEVKVILWRHAVLRKLSREDDRGEVADETHILGEGQSGTVFRVRNARTGQLGAMKMHCGPCTTVDDERFRKERRIYEEQPIPGDMPAYYGKGRWKGVDYFVMELVERFKPRGEGVDLIGYFIALTFVYEKLNRRYLHLDGKLANFAVREGRPVLIDFSCAVAVEDGRTMCVRTGTRKYRSPEAREGRPLTVQSDIYTVAAVLQGLLADERERRVYGDAISHAMANDERERTKSWAEFRKELKEAAAKYRREAAAECRLAKFRAVAGAVVGAVGVVALVASALHVHNRERHSGYSSSDERIGLNAYAATNFVKAAHFLQRAADTGRGSSWRLSSSSDVRLRGHAMSANRTR